ESVMRIKLQCIERVRVILNPLVVESLKIFCLGKLRRTPIVIAMDDFVVIVGFVSKKIVELQPESVVQCKLRNSHLIALHEDDSLDVVWRGDLGNGLCNR